MKNTRKINDPSGAAGGWQLVNGDWLPCNLDCSFKLIDQATW